MRANSTPQYFGLSAAARVLGISESTLRRYTETGIINPERDSSGRRLFTSADISKAQSYIDRHKDSHAD